MSGRRDSPEPPAPATLVEVLERRARSEPGRPAFTFAGRDHTYGALWGEIERAAGALAELGVGAGDRALLALPNGPQLFAALYGAQRLGAVAVPIAARSGVERVADLARRCAAKAVVLPAEAPEEQAGAVAAAFAGDPGTAPAVLAGCRPSAAAPPPPPAAVPPDATALLQYTSGTTGDPKGVVLTHAHFLTNVRQMIAGMEITAEDVFVSWLPVHHDMGLVLMTMVPFFLGARLVLLPDSLRDVRPWLEAIARHRGTFTAAPDFAYRLCLWSIRDPARYDLSSLRVALNAAEPVRAETIRRFEAIFGLERVMVAGYGLAEATVGVSMQPPGTAPRVAERGFVAIGRPFPGVRLEVVVDGRPAAAGEIGELTVESPAVTSGYFRDPGATAALFVRPGVIRTGDLAYRDAAGDVFLVGRSKEIILQAGENLAPQEIEEAVEALPFVRRAAAVGIDRGRAEGEQAYVFVELRRAAPPPPERLHELAGEVVSRVHARLGVRPGRVLLVRPRSIPMTGNGKLKRSALRTRYLDGALAAEGRIFFPRDPSPAGAPAGSA